MSVYKIPLKFKAGEYKFDELNADDGSAALELDYNTEYQLITYDVPLYGGDARIYTVPRERMPDALTAVYDKNGELESVGFDDNGRARLFYIRFKNTGIPGSGLMKFVKEQADGISAEIIGQKQTLARIFVEKFYDGEAADIAVRTADADEMRAVIDKYNGSARAADNSGNYPIANRRELDRETLGVMLMCTDGNLRNMLFDKAVKAFAERLESRVLKKIKTTADFKFICEEYD